MIHKTNKGYYEVRYKWRKKMRYVTMGCICTMHLNAAKKYQDNINQIRQECKRTRQPLPIDLPKPEKIPCVGKMIEEHKSFTQSDDSLPAHLFLQVIDRAHELKLTDEQYLNFLGQCQANYTKLLSEKKLKAAQAKAKRSATIAAKKASKLNGRAKPSNNSQ